MTIWREMAAAGPGCALANGLLNGFETTKVKLQLHDTFKNPVYRTPTTLGVMSQIVEEEGLFRGLLTPGLSASLTRSMLYGAYRVGLYSGARDWLASATNTTSTPTSASRSDPQIHHRLVSGMFTGGLGAMLTCPLDVIRTRMQAEAGLIQEGIYITGLRKGEAARYTSMWATLTSICQNEGWRRLYRGSHVTVARACLLNGSQLASYDTMKQELLLSTYWQQGPLLHVFCAFCSGVVAQTVVMPLDTIKSAMMVGGTLSDVWTVMMRSQGLRWFYRGYLPACAGQGLVMVLQMPLIEEFRRLLGVAAI